MSPDVAVSEGAPPQPPAPPADLIPPLPPADAEAPPAWTSAGAATPPPAEPRRVKPENDRRQIPRPPATIEEVGIPVGLLEDIFMRRLMSMKRGSTSELARDLALSLSAVQQIADELRDKKHLEYLGIDGRDYQFALTEAGHHSTVERQKISLYSGHVPVSLNDYHEMVRHQQIKQRVTKSSVRAAMSDLVFPDRLMDKLGGAMLNEGAVFIYGPPGTGKTSMAERMGRIVDEPILVPHCIEVDGNVVMVFDPSVHKAVEQPAGLDPRWVACERPFVLIGGELNMGMLDVSHDQVSGVFSPPKQLLANNGMLVIDDFGRQAATPDEILNRWIVPLSREIDFLKLSNGTTFTTPFAVKLVVSSNLDPNSLGDEAFLRRLRNKVYVGSCDDADFDEILAHAAETFDIKLTARAPAHLRDLARRYVGNLRPYIAVDFCDLMQGICEYEELPPIMDPTMIDHVAEVYFVEPDPMT